MGFFSSIQPKPAAPAPSAPSLATPVSNPLGLPEFLARLAVGDRDRLSGTAVDLTARRLGLPIPVLRAVVDVEADGREGFGVAGLPTMKFDPAVFSRLTGGRFDHTNPDISYAQPDDRRLPASPVLRWRQLGKAYVMNADAALNSASWGRFALPAEDHEHYGFADAAAMGAGMAESEERQLAALEEWLRRSGAVALLKARDWDAYAARRAPESGRHLASRLYWAHRALTEKKKRRFL